MAKARASDERVKDLIRRGRVWTAEWGDEMRLAWRERLYEVHGFADLVSYAHARGSEQSASDLKHLVKLVERLDGLSDMRTAFEAGDVPPTKLREAAREADRRGGSLEVQAELLADARTLTSRELEEKYRSARGQPVVHSRRVEVQGEDDAALQQVVVALRSADPELTESRAIGIACSAFLAARTTERGAAAGGAASDGGAGSADGETSDGHRAGRPALPVATRLVLHLAVPAEVATTPGATKAQAALETAAAALATVAETRQGPVELSRARLEQELCNAQIHDVRTGPSQITHTVPPKVARHVHDRDHGRCRAPGCSNLGFLHVHHEPGRWVVGHDPDKMLCLCSCHHAMRHDGLLGIDPVPGGFVFTAADGSPPTFVPLDPGVRVPTVPPKCADAQGARSTSEARPSDEERDAVLALVALELKLSDARERVRGANASLVSRGARIDAGSLVHEALRLMPSPGARRGA